MPSRGKMSNCEIKENEFFMLKVFLETINLIADTAEYKFSKCQLRLIINIAGRSVA